MRPVERFTAAGESTEGLFDRGRGGGGVLHVIDSRGFSELKKKKRVDCEFEESLFATSAVTTVVA